jgi:hypothetical protein
MNIKKNSLTTNIEKKLFTMTGEFVNNQKKNEKIYLIKIKLLNTVIKFFLNEERQEISVE